MARKATKHTRYKNKPWEGFHACAYNLDHQKVRALPMMEIVKDEAGKEISSETTLGQVLFTTLHDEEVLEVDSRQ